MSEEGGPSFATTPSWVIGVVVFVIVGASLGIDELLSKLGEFLKKKDKIPLYEALQKIKEELMLMGFVSLLLVFVQTKVIHWCVPEVYVDDWLPCHVTNTTTPALQQFSLSSSSRRRRLLAEEPEFLSSCKEGEVPFIALEVLHDLHYLIFILAVVHVFSCTITVLLGEAKISMWSKWEVELKNKELDDDKKDEIMDIKKFAFIKERFHGIDARKRYFVFSFFKHLCGVMTKTDYEAMRFGFIFTHCDGNQKFNFHQYMVHAYEADFTSVVSIRWFLWLYAVVSLTLNVAGWNIFFWLSFPPLLLLLAVGTKLEQVITDLATYLGQRHTVVFGVIKIEPRDEYFWFKKPRLILVAIHIILFMNSFGFAIFFWTLFKFNFNSCIMGDTVYAVARLVLLVVVQTIISYSTLPLYAVVSQMGTNFHKKAMLKYSQSVHGGSVTEHNAEAAVEDMDI